MWYLCFKQFVISVCWFLLVLCKLFCCFSYSCDDKSVFIQSLSETRDQLWLMWNCEIYVKLWLFSHAFIKMH